MPRMVNVYLPVLDVGRSMDFFSRLGFEFDRAFTDANASCMVLSDLACVMLLVRPFFAGFTPKAVADPASSTAAILALTADSRADVDVLVDAALDLGGQVCGAVRDEGYLYGRAFFDLDGHAWEVTWADPQAVG